MDFGKTSQIKIKVIQKIQVQTEKNKRIQKEKI